MQGNYDTLLRREVAAVDVPFPEKMSLVALDGSPQATFPSGQLVGRGTGLALGWEGPWYPVSQSTAALSAGAGNMG